MKLHLDAIFCYTLHVGYELELIILNLNVNFGDLIYLHHPSNWDDWIEEDRKAKIKNMVLSKPEKNRISNQTWFELSTNFQKEFPRNHKDIFEDKINNRILD